MIIFDLDGTLADCDHRRHFIDPAKNAEYEYSNFGKDPITREMTVKEFPNWHRKDNVDVRWKPDWTTFYEACENDEPLYQTIGVFKMLSHCEAPIEIWSGRCESVRSKTEYWINNHVTPLQWNSWRLRMRPIGDYTPDEHLKERWLDEAIAEGKTIDFVFDDRPKVVRLWRRRGIFVFDCNQSGTEF